MTDRPDMVGAYRLERQIGPGAMGTVHLAVDQRLGRYVAVKLMHRHLGTEPAYLARFNQEAAVLARLDAPHIIPIYDHGQVDGSPYLVMQYAAGGDLGALLRSNGPMPPALVAELAAQVCDALADAHAVGVIHRDVKPGNVLLREPDLSRPHIYLGDFGVAFTEPSGLTATGSVAGTWDYLAPERSHGDPGSPASDVYAVGCLIHEMLTGRPPYTGNDVQVAMAHLDAPVPQLPGRDAMTHGLNTVLTRTMAKHPGQRPSAAQLRDELRGLVRGAQPTLPPAQPSTFPPAQPATFSPAMGATVPPGGPHGPTTGGFAGPFPATRAPRRRRGTIAAIVAAVAVLAAAGVGAGVYAATRDHHDGATTAEPSTAPSGTGSPAADNTAHHAVTGDLNGDRRGDLAYYDSSGHGLYLSTGHSFEPRSSPAYMKANDALGAVECDVDGDHRTDLITYGYEGEVIVHHPGSTRTQRLHFPSSYHPAGIDCADFNGDGHPDIGAWSAGENDNALTFSVSLNLGNNVWSQARTWLTFRDGRRDIAYQTRHIAADWDGDGKADLAIFSRDDDSFVTYLSTGSTMKPRGGRVDADTIGHARSGTENPVVAADTDGDGREELVVVHYDGTLVDLTYNGSSWGPHGTLAAGGDSQVFVTVATAVDLDGDGRDEIVAAEEGSPWIFRRDANGFRAPVRWRIAAPGDYWQDLVGTSTSR